MAGVFSELTFFWQVSLRPSVSHTLPSGTQTRTVPVGDHPHGTTRGPSQLPMPYRNCGSQPIKSHHLILHSSTHEECLEQLDLLLQQLIQHGIKINLPNCDFGSKEVSYLGFQLTEAGILPEADKLKAIQNSPLLTSIQEILGPLQLLLGSHVEFHLDHLHPDCPDQERKQMERNTSSI